MDSIDFKCLKNLPIKYKLLLLVIYNKMYQTSLYPSSWRYSFIHFIPKPNSDGLRPISLTSCTCKLFETLLKNRIQWWVEHENLIPSSQQGFRKRRSCSDNLINFSLKIKEAFLEKKQILAAFLYVQGAFDNVDTDILLDRLAEIGCPENTILFIKFLTLERTCFSDTNENYPRFIYKGVPQDGILSPLLYMIFVATIVKNIKKKCLYRPIRRSHSTVRKIHF